MTHHSKKSMWRCGLGTSYQITFNWFSEGIQRNKGENRENRDNKYKETRETRETIETRLTLTCDGHLSLICACLSLPFRSFFFFLKIILPFLPKKMVQEKTFKRALPASEKYLALDPLSRYSITLAQQNRRLNLAILFLKSDYLFEVVIRKRGGMTNNPLLAAAIQQSFASQVFKCISKMSWFW